MRRAWWTGIPVLCLVSGCVGELGAYDTKAASGPVPGRTGGPDGYVLTIDTSATDSYAPAHATSWTISGRVVASEGLSSLSVGGGPVPVGAGGQFTRDVSLMPGLNLVPIEASDMGAPPHLRQGHRAILATDYLPEGHINPRAASLTLTNEILADMAAPLAGLVSGLDIAAEIRSRPTLTDDECRTVPDSASHGTPTLSLTVDGTGALWLEIRIPGLDVRYHGRCSTFLFSADVTGRMQTDVVLRTQLTAPPGDVCITGLAHTPPVVDLVGFDNSVSGGGSLLELLIVTLAAEIKEGDTADALKAEFEAQADMLLSSELMGLTVFNVSETMTLFDTAIDVRLCMTGLVTEGGALRAIVGANAMGPSGGDVAGAAPGAPIVAGELPAVSPGKLWLDANLVGQLLFSAWHAGGLADDAVEEIPLDTLMIVVPDLRGRYPAGTMARIGIDGQMPPLVRAAAPGDGDLLLEIGELHLLISAGDDLLFRIGAVIRMTLELAPDGASLRPEVSDVTADTWIIEEPVVDADEEVLNAAIQLQIGTAASALLGDATIGLPDIGGAVVPTDVTASPGGRYVEITLAP